MAQWRLDTLQRNKKPAYLLVQWCDEDDGEHSVIEGKVTNLLDAESGFVPGAKVLCKLKEGDYTATILTTGTRTECYAAQAEREKRMQMAGSDTKEVSDCDTTRSVGDKDTKDAAAKAGVSKSDILCEDMDDDLPTEPTTMTPAMPQSKDSLTKPPAKSNEATKEPSDSQGAILRLTQKRKLPSKQTRGEYLKPKKKKPATLSSKDLSPKSDSEGTQTECYAAQAEREKRMQMAVSDTEEVSDCDTNMSVGDKDTKDVAAKAGVSTRTQAPKSPEELSDDPGSILKQNQKGKLSSTGTKGKGPRSKKKVSAKAMEVSSMEMGKGILQEILEGNLPDTSTPLKTQDSPEEEKPDQISSPISDGKGHHDEQLLKHPYTESFSHQSPPYSMHRTSYSPPGFMYRPIPRSQLWTPREPDDISDRGSSYSHFSTPEPGYSVHGLRDLFLSVNAQTQTAIASLDVSLQSISSDVKALRDQLRRPGLKKKKSEEHDRTPIRDEQEGAVLGNVKGSVRQKVVLPGVPQAKILEAERLTDTPEKLALALLLILFTQEELSQGNCTKPMRADIQQLDSERLWAIKCHVDFVYPVISELDGREGDIDRDKKVMKRWTTIIQKVLNPKCRQLRISSTHKYLELSVPN